MPRYGRIFAMGIALCLALVFSAAKCTEHETLKQNEDGSWTLTGEFHNTSDVYASGISLGGTLLDANGNVVGWSPGSQQCIDVLSPDASIPFELDFVKLSEEEPVSWVVGATKGRTLDEPLPDAELRVKDLKASWTGGPGSSLRITGDLVNDSDRTYQDFPQACVAVYDAAGNVIAVTEDWRDLETALKPGGTQEIDSIYVDFVGADANSIRYWVTNGCTCDPAAPAYAAVSTALVPIK